ncbi:15-hydroxyprostaglandin dehydrogenase [NAD(+)]-like [Salarias fasciatus]|uniref:15-hydroxyprostaglandin dehydrogenase [NAD(+)] n=1 Tax=Salarias fasciatus TaxID=181472 RepID=A0A672GDX0_SALFA|nr:15-hydroxyprostaglandin dehydrogenase [NAD(+)]-like [Salarias fasciatus]
MSLDGKAAVVTGAAVGIGKAAVEILLQNGAKVAILDINRTAGENLKEDLNKQYGAEKTLFLQCDVESEEQFKAAFEEAAKTFGGVDILCNNAGIMNEAAWEKSVTINTMGVIRGSYLALEHMNKLKGGRGGVVVNMSSMAGLGPFLSCPVYTATKHAVLGFTRSMAAASAVSGYGLRFNALCPGFVQTDMISDVTSRLGRFSHLSDATMQLVEKIGIINVSEVAECLLELVTDETRNGEALLVFQKGRKYVTFPSFVQ